MYSFWCFSFVHDTIIWAVTKFAVFQKLNAAARTGSAERLKTDFLKVRPLLLNLIMPSCSPKAADAPYIVPAAAFHVDPRAQSLWIILRQVRRLSSIFRPKKRGSDSSCHHTCSPAALYVGQWCFVSRSRSNASHQTNWTRASNWTSKVSTIFSAGARQPVFSVLNMQDWPGAFHGPLSFFLLTLWLQNAGNRKFFVADIASFLHTLSDENAYLYVKSTKLLQALQRRAVAV